MSVIEDATGLDPTTGEEFGSTISNLEASVVSETHVGFLNVNWSVLIANPSATGC